MIKILFILLCPYKMQVSVIETLLSPSQRLHVRILIKIVIIKENSNHRWTIRIRKRQEPLFFFSFPFPLSSMHLPFALSPASLQHNEACAEAGADPGFFLGESALLSCSASTPKNHIVFFFFAEYQLYWKTAGHLRGGGSAHPLHPPPRSVPGRVM